MIRWRLTIHQSDTSVLDERTIIIVAVKRNIRAATPMTTNVSVIRRSIAI